VPKQKRREEALDRYTYGVEQLLEERDDRGAVTRRRVRSYEVFYVRGRPVWKRVAEDGRPLRLRLSAILERYDFRTEAIQPP